MYRKYWIFGTLNHTHYIISWSIIYWDFWQGGVCLAFADEVLCWLYGTVKESKKPFNNLSWPLEPINCYEVRKNSSWRTWVSEISNFLPFPSFFFVTRNWTLVLKVPNWWKAHCMVADEDYILQFAPPSQRLELLQANSCPEVITDHIGQL